MWLDKLKIAIIEKNIESLTLLLNDIPVLENSKDREQVLYLLKEATAVFTNLKNEVAINMGKIKKNLLFLQSTRIPIPSRPRLDIRS